MPTFEQYLSEHQIDPIRLSLRAGVPYLTVRYAIDEKPIFSHNALKIRVALHNLTGCAYTGSFSLLDEPETDQLPTVPRENSTENTTKNRNEDEMEGLHL